jgi:hypothetical protein
VEEEREDTPKQLNSSSDNLPLTDRNTLGMNVSASCDSPTPGGNKLNQQEGEIRNNSAVFVQGEDII